MAKAIIRGYYGMDNTGDDAFLAVCAWGARKYCKSDILYATASHIPDTYGIAIRPIHVNAKYHGARWLNMIADYFCTQKTNWTIFGGGSNFHTGRQMEYEAKIINRVATVRCFAAGVSIGPFRDLAAERACAKLLRRMEFVGVRDDSSYQTACSIAPKTRIKLTFDLAPLLPLVSAKPIDTTQQRKGLGISLCNYERFINKNMDQEITRQKIIAKAICRCAKAGLVDEVTFIDFNGHPVMGDNEIHAAIIDMINGAVRVKHLNYHNDPLAVMQSVARLKGIIAMRLHAAVFGFCTGTPVLLLAYHQKCYDWATMIGLPLQLLIDAGQVEASDFVRSMEQLLESSLSPSLSLAQAQARAISNWNWLQA